MIQKETVLGAKEKGIAGHGSRERSDDVLMIVLIFHMYHLPKVGKLIEPFRLMKIQGFGRDLGLMYEVLRCIFYSTYLR